MTSAAEHRAQTLANIAREYLAAKARRPKKTPPKEYEASFRILSDAIRLSTWS